MNIIVATPEGTRLQLVASPGQKLMEVLKKEDIGIDGICGGMRSCATCHVHLGDAWLSLVGMRGKEEQDLLAYSESYCPGRSRLSCQIELTSQLDGLEVSVIGA